MADETNASGKVYAKGMEGNYGLHAGVLGPLETLAQSISAVAPSTSPSLTIPLVFALAGNATWFVYMLATGATLLVGFCVSRFARLSASPGSLYSYASDTLPPIYGVVAAWALLIAYLATGASVAGGALYYARMLTEQFFHFSIPAIPLLMFACAITAWIAYRDVKLSAELMLWIEVIAVSFILIVLAVLVFRFGFQVDLNQLRLKGAHVSSLGPALVLSIFSFVGFESATTLGSEARDPLRTIPRAVLQSAILTGTFFMLCSYSVVLGFHDEPSKLSASSSPIQELATRAGVSPLGVAINFGALVSMFACILACTTAAARVLLRMAHSGLLPKTMESTNKEHGTPGAAIALSSGLMLAATLALQMEGFSGSDMYDLMGSLAVFGFLTAYALVALALPFARRALGQHSHVVAAVSVLTALVMLMIAVFDLRSTADAAHARIPYIYVGYILAGVSWYLLRGKAVSVAAEEA